MDPRTIDTTRMLVQIAPTIFADERFALKGGTAINLFERDLPRLSVDLDLVLVDGRFRVACALQQGDAPDPLLADYPTLADGARGVRFIEKALESAASVQKWTDF